MTHDARITEQCGICARDLVDGYICARCDDPYFAEVEPCHLCLACEGHTLDCPFASDLPF